MNNEGVVNEVLANEVVDTNTATDSVPDADALPSGYKINNDDESPVDDDPLNPPPGDLPQ